jgi:hypothetical protein
MPIERGAPQFIFSVEEAEARNLIEIQRKRLATSVGQFMQGQGGTEETAVPLAHVGPTPRMLHYASASLRNAGGNGRMTGTRCGVPARP